MTVKMCIRDRYTLVITDLWSRLKKEVVSIEIVHFEKYFKYKS